MAKAIALVSALCIVALVATVAHAHNQVFNVEGDVYCDPCRVQFQTELSEKLPGNIYIYSFCHNLLRFSHLSLKKKQKACNIFTTVRLCRGHGETGVQERGDEGVVILGGGCDRRKRQVQPPSAWRPPGRRVHSEGHQEP